MNVLSQDYDTLDRTITDLILTHVLDAIDGKPLAAGEDRLPHLPTFWLSIPTLVRGRMVSRYLPHSFRDLPSDVQIAAESALADVATEYAKRTGLLDCAKAVLQ